MMEDNDTLRSPSGIPESGSRPPGTARRRPVCAWLSLALPLLGLPLAFAVGHLPSIQGTGQFACFAPAIFACLAAFPLSLIGLTLAVTGIVRKERWIAVAVVGVLLNLVVLLPSAPMALDWARTCNR